MKCNRSPQPLIHRVPREPVARTETCYLMVFCMMWVYCHAAEGTFWQCGIWEDFWYATHITFAARPGEGEFLCGFVGDYFLGGLWGALHLHCLMMLGVQYAYLLSKPLHWTMQFRSFDFRLRKEATTCYGRCAIPTAFTSRLSRWPESGPCWQFGTNNWGLMVRFCILQFVSLSEADDVLHCCAYTQGGKIFLFDHTDQEKEPTSSVAIPLHWPVLLNFRDDFGSPERYFFLFLLQDMTWQFLGLPHYNHCSFPLSGPHGLTVDTLEPWIFCTLSTSSCSKHGSTFLATKLPLLDKSVPLRRTCPYCRADHSGSANPLHWRQPAYVIGELYRLLQCNIRLFLCAEGTRAISKCTGHHGLTVEFMVIFVRDASFLFFCEPFLAGKVIPLHWPCLCLTDGYSGSAKPLHWLEPQFDIFLTGLESTPLRWTLPDECKFTHFGTQYFHFNAEVVLQDTHLRWYWPRSYLLKSRVIHGLLTIVILGSHAGPIVMAVSSLLWAMPSFGCQFCPHFGVILRGVLLPKSNKIFASSFGPFSWPDFWFCSFSERVSLGSRHRDWDPYTASRVGEAQHPGPQGHKCLFRMAQVNPTSVYQKSDLLHMQGEVVLCAETSATQGVQIQETAELRRLEYSTVWSPPQPPQRITIQATEDLCGKAAGLMAMSKFPLRTAQHQEPLAMWRAGRYLRSFLTVGSLTIQIVQIYGYPSCHADSRYMTNELCRHACSEAMQLDMPTIYAGDFNHPPATLPAFQVLLAKGYTTSQQLYGRLHQREQPPTCRDATYNDGFLFCPATVHWVRNIIVEEQFLFADHTPVQLEISLPVETPTRTIWRLPHSWTQFDPPVADFAQQYQTLRQAPPESLTQWAQICEQAVDGALKASHHRDPVRHPYGTLPRRARDVAVPGNVFKFLSFSEFAQQACISMLRPSMDLQLTFGKLSVNSVVSKAFTVDCRSSRRTQRCHPTGSN